jgi:hypothetical protein
MIRPRSNGDLVMGLTCGLWNIADSLTPMHRLALEVDLFVAEVHTSL